MSVLASTLSKRIEKPTTEQEVAAKQILKHKILKVALTLVTLRLMFEISVSKVYLVLCTL